jgi:hypothetical protein
MENLLKYIKVDNGNAYVLRTSQEIENNSPNSNRQQKIDYIMERVFSKYDLEALLEKLAVQYFLNWYDMKNTHNDFIKQSVFRKIKQRLSHNF